MDKILRSRICQQLAGYANNHPELLTLVRTFEESGLSPKWVAMYKELSVSIPKKAIVLRAIMGDPFISDYRPAPDPERLYAYVQYCYFHPQRLHDPATYIMGDSHERSPKFLRQALGLQATSPMALVAKILETPRFIDRYLENELVQSVIRDTQLPDETIRQWFSDQGPKRAISHYLKTIPSQTGVFNLIKFTLVFFRQPYSGRLQDKVPVTLRNALGIERGIPAYLAALDVISLKIQNVIPSTGESPLSRIARAITSMPKKQTTEFRRLISSLGWLTPDSLAALEGKKSKTVMVGSRIYSGLLFNIDRAMETVPGGEVYREIFEEASMEAIVRQAEKLYGTTNAIKKAVFHHNLQSALPVALRDLINIYHWVDLVERSSVRSERIDYAKALPAVAQWRLGVSRSDSVEGGAPKAKTANLNNKILRLLNAPEVATRWRPGMRMAPGETVLVPRAFVPGLHIPEGCSVIEYGPDKINPEDNPFLELGILSQKKI